MYHAHLTRRCRQLFKRQTDEVSAKAKDKQDKRHSQFKVVAKRVGVISPLTLLPF